MIGGFNPAHREAVVIGGGMAGLLTAYFAQTRGYQVTLYEKSDRLGGLVQTHALPWGMAEQAAHSFLASPVVAQLMREIGVDLVGVSKDASARYILRGGTFRKFPLGFLEMARLLKRAFSARAPKIGTESGLTLAEWTERHLGSAALKYLVSPMVTGIYACAPEELAQAAAFPRFNIPPGATLASTHLGKRKSTTRGPMVTARHGMSEIVEKLVRAYRLAGGKIEMNRTMDSLPSGNVAICTPASAAAQLFTQAGEPGLADSLQTIRYAPLISITLLVKKTLTLPTGVGVLFPREENRKSLGILFNSSAFPDRTRDASVASFTVMVGGTGNPRALDLDDASLVKLAASEMGAVFKAPVELIESKVFRWPQAIPIYNQALMESWSVAQRTWCAQPGRILFGNYTGEVSLRGMVERAAAEIHRIT